MYAASYAYHIAACMQSLFRARPAVGKLEMQLRFLSLLLGLCAPGVGAKLVRPSIPPRGVNSFDIQYARRDPNSTVPVWNEAEFRELATAMSSQLLPVGY